MYRNTLLLGLGLMLSLLVPLSGVAQTSGENALPPELAKIRLLEERVKLRDGVHLATDIYLPEGEGPFPTLFTPTPYNSRQDPNSTFERMMAARGYAVVHQNVRGRFGSEGEFSPFLDEIPDLVDAVEWMVAQPWCDGRIGLIGSSSQSYSNQLLASTQHPALKALVNLSGLTNPWEVIFPGGAFRLDTLYPWMQFFYLGKPIRDMEEWQRRFRHRPMAENFEWGADLYYRMADNVVPVEKIQIPCLHVTGWNDVVYRQTFMFYEGVSDGVDQQLVVGPWLHNQIGSGKAVAGDEDFGEAAELDGEWLLEVVIGWFDRHVKEESGPSDPRVRAFVMGSDAWHDYETWPPREATQKRLFLTRNGDGSAGKLTPAAVSGKPSSEFVFDPANPVPTYGGVNSHIFAHNAGPRDQTKFGERKDVLRFLSDPADEPYALAGPMHVVLHAASSATDTDFTAKLSVVRPDGYIRIIEDGIVRARHRNGHDRTDLLEPGSVVRYEIHLGDTAIRINEGESLCLDISSSNFPKYDLNPNTGEDAFTAETAVPASQTVHHSPEMPSELVITVLEVPGDRVAGHE